MRERRIKRGLGALLGVLLVLLLAAFATGRISIAVTRGISMLPAFHTGDLTILRAAGSYHVGEIVSYRSPLLHTTVLHRIVAENHGLFTFKGDNNDFVDPVKLPASAIGGMLLLHIPRGGALLEWLQNPAHGLPALALVIAAIAFATTRRRRGREGSPRRTSRPSRPLRTLVPAIGANGSLFVGIGVVVALGSGLLLAMGLSTPAKRTASSPVPYTEETAFSYSAAVPKSTTYPTGLVSTGSPIFLKIVHALTVGAKYQLHTAGSSDITGTITLQAILQESDGWSRVIASSTPTPFTGTAASASLDLPIKAALTAMSQSAEETGLGDGGESIVVVPTVTVDGTIAGQPFSDKQSPSLSFQMSPLEMNLLSSSAPGSTGNFPQLLDKHSGQVEQPTTLPGEVGVIGHDLGVGTARSLGTTGLLLGLCLVLAGLAFVWRNRDTPEDERIRQRVRDELVPIANDPSEAMRGVVNVATMAALASLSQRYDVAILEREEGVDHIYYAVVGDLVYRYRREPEWRADANVVLLNASASRPLDQPAGEASSG